VGIINTELLDSRFKFEFYITATNFRLITFKGFTTGLRIPFFGITEKLLPRTVIINNFNNEQRTEIAKLIINIVKNVF